MRARLGVERAAVGDDVARDAALDRADVRASSPRRAARAACRRSRAPAAAIAERPSSGAMPACAARPTKRDLHDRRSAARRGSPRRSAPPVVDVAEPRRRAGRSRRRRRPCRPTSSFGVKTSSSPACGRPSSTTPPRRLDHRGDRGLVVGAEDRPAGVPHDSVLDHGLDRAGRRHGVHVRAEEERRPLGGRRPGGSTGCRCSTRSAAPASSSSTSRPSPRSSAATRSATARSSPGRRRQRGEIEEEVEDAH